MKFSVLLPTRNRLEYLRYAVDSVRMQNYENWEIIISDNCSEQDIKGFVESLDDDRITYIKTSAFVPVTDNWNNALRHSNGDYVIMLGDDDGLLPDYFTTVIDAMQKFPDPDFIYGGAVFFAYPGVLPNEPKGVLRNDRNMFSFGVEPKWLDPVAARKVAQGYLNFRMPVASNMQFSLISRRKIEELTYEGAFFHSPFPDFYATPLLFLTSAKILMLPQPIAIIGITPKSYGFYHFNNLSSSGVTFLNNTGQLEAGSKYISAMLPGTSYNDSWLMANLALSHNFARFFGLKSRLYIYRRLQIIHGYKHRYFDRNLEKADFSMLISKMSVLERITYSPVLRLAFSAIRALPNSWRGKVVDKLRKLIGQHAMSDRIETKVSLNNLIDVYEYAENNALI